MAKPLVAVETIYDTALQLLEEQGADALSARNLAAALKCSTRTLYQQVGKRDELIGKLVDYYFHGRDLDFHRGENWQDTAWSWSSTLRGALLSHPNLTRLMTLEHRAPIADYATALLKELLQAEFGEELALRSTRVLTNMVINLTRAEIFALQSASPRTPRSKKEMRFEDLVIARSGKNRKKLQSPPEVFENAIRWTMAGITIELQEREQNNRA